MRIPYALWGMFLVPIAALFVFILKGFCPEGTDGMCLADWFATPIFLPLVATYKLFGTVPGPNGQEFLFLMLYWALVGLLLGLILDLCTRRSRYLPGPRPPL